MAKGFIILADRTLPTGSRLWGGSDIYCWVARASITCQNNLDVAFRPNQQSEFSSNTSLVAQADNNNVGSAWNRRKAKIQNSGHENMQITLQGGWQISQVGSAPTDFGTGSPVFLSPYKIVRMALSGHTFYLRGGTAIQYLIDGEANDILPHASAQVGSLYTGSGIPIQIATWAVNDEIPSSEYVTWNMTLIEDKDTIQLTN